MSKVSKLSCLQNPPHLNINDVLHPDGNIIPRVRLEQRIVWNLLLELEKAGFTPHSVWDGEEETSTTSKKAVMEAVFNLDDARVYFAHRSRETVNGRLHKVWVYLVMGNDGVDVISDYNATNWRGFETVMDKFNPEVYA